MKLYSLKGDHQFLHCSMYDTHPMHIVENGEIDEADWKHLLEEFPDSLSKVNPNAPVVVEEVAESNPTVEVNNGIIS